jgi:protoporphyrinogen/coproporphyrinogen III oxidase
MKVAVIGAGISGLTAALRLQSSGHQVQVFEADSHPGGRMWTRSVGGFSVDVGAHMLLDCFERTRALVDELGLGDSWFEVVAGAGGGVLHDHELASFSPKNAFDVLRYRGLSLRGRFRVLLAFLRAARHDGDLDFFDLSVGDDALDHEDCDAFARRNLGDEATDYIVDCFIRTFHFHGARKMSAKYLEALLALLLSQRGFEVCALRGHMKALPEAMAARLRVHYGVEVAQVTPLSEGVQVVSAHGSQRYDAVVLATPAEVARALLRAPTPRQREVLEHACSSRTALCVFRVPTELAGTFEGVWVPFVESTLISGLANDACMGTQRGEWTLFSVWLHEEAAEELWERPDEALLAVVLEELNRLFPRYRGDLHPLHVERWRHALPVYGVGQVSRVRAFWERGQGEGGIWLCGDYLNHPWLEGAVRCGEKVAMRLHTRALTRLMPSIPAEASNE